MRLSSWRGLIAALVGVTLLSCVDSLTAPSPTPIGGGIRKVDAVAGSKVVISQIYGGGGNASATFRNDYVELFNAGTASQDLTGWSVQYASNTGAGNLGANSGQLVALTGSIAPGQYYLVQLFSQAAIGATLPTPQVTGTINMAGGAGKVALVDQATTIGCNGGSNPCTPEQLARIIDLVGYGNANFFEGTGAAPTLSSTLAAVRAEHGCTDTDNNSADFTAATPAPRNSSSPLASCEPIVIGPLDHIVVTGPTAVNVGSTITLTAELQDATSQTIDDPAATFTWTSGDEASAQIISTTGNTATISGIQVGGPVTITVTATSDAVSATATPTVTVTGGGVIVPSTTFVSEIHYDNTGTDAGEAIEIEGDAETSLEGWNLLLYTGTPGSSNLGGVYSTIPLAGVIPATCGTRGVLVFNIAGIQNGEADGWALVNAEGGVTELKSYEGTFAATSGAAAGLTSVALDADETSPTLLGRSVQRAGNGVWFGPRTSTFGACNPPLPLGPQGSVTVTSGKTDLAFAMQTQFFFGGTDLTGQPVTSVVWSTSNPDIITVDQRGVVTAEGLGAAQLIATAPDGAIGTVDMTVYLAAGATIPLRLGHNTEFGEPDDANPSDDFLIRRAQYTVSYNPQRGGANWVSWNLSATHIGDNGRCPGTCYSADTALSNAGLTAYTTADWVSNAPGVIGYDRGHMAPSADWTSSEADNNTTFFMTNFLPQRADLNQGPWVQLEDALRDSVTAGREVYIIAGGIFTNGVGLGTLRDLGRIGIPDSTYKIAVITPAGTGLSADGTLPANTTVLAVNMPNVNLIRGVVWTTYLTTVGKIENSTGYDFLELLADAVECRVEVRNCGPTASITSELSGSGWQTTEGQTVAFDGTGSTDPDAGDALSLVWSINGTQVGTGGVLSITFENDGLYQVRLTATDQSGATNVSTVNVVALNVAPMIGAFSGATILRGETYTASGSFADPGADSWTGQVNYGDGSGTSSLGLTGKSFSLSHVYRTAGSFTVVVNVGDGTVTSIRNATVLVKSAAQAFGELSVAVGTLPLQRGQIAALQALLKAAQKQLAAGHSKPVLAVLEGFIHVVRAGIQSGRISEAKGLPVVLYAQRLVASIKAP